MTHVASRTRPSLFLRVTLKGGCGLGTRLLVRSILAYVYVFVYVHVHGI